MFYKQNPCWPGDEWQAFHIDYIGGWGWGWFTLLCYMCICIYVPSMVRITDEKRKIKIIYFILWYIIVGAFVTEFGVPFQFRLICYTLTLFVTTEQRALRSVREKCVRCNDCDPRPRYIHIYHIYSENIVMNEPHRS